MTEDTKMESLEALHDYLSTIINASIWLKEIADDPSRFSMEELKERCELGSALLKLQADGLAFISNSPESLELVKEILD